MKGIIISLSAILVLTLTVCLFGAVTAARLSEIADTLTRAETDGGDAVREAKELFEKHELLLSLTVPDDSMITIYSGLCESIELSKSEERASFLGAINRLAAEIEQTGRLNGLYFCSLF